MKLRACFQRALAGILILCFTIVPALAAESSMSHFVKTAVYTPFSDVPVDAWYGDSVKTAVELGIMKGKGEGLFDPLGGVTLAEVVTMAANVRSIYEGGGFTSGGSPWYHNAVTYAETHGILAVGEYSDFTLPATREDMVRVFAYALPAPEYARINRIAYIPDFSRAEVGAGDVLFLLYNAGILKGDATGAAHALDGVTRAEAATIICRVAVPELRVRFSLTELAPGTPLESKMGDFWVSLPEGWTTEDSEWLALQAYAPSGRASVFIQRLDKVLYPGHDLESLAQFCYDSLPETFPTLSFHQNELVAPYPVYLRGFFSMRYQFDGNAQGSWHGYQVNCVENSNFYYLIYSINGSGCTDAEWQQVLDVVYSFDLEL